MLRAGGGGDSAGGDGDAAGGRDAIAPRAALLPRRLRAPILGFCQACRFKVGGLNQRFPGRSMTRNKAS